MVYLLKMVIFYSRLPESMLWKGSMISRQLLAIREFLNLSGWWFGYPAEKYESQLGWLFQIYGKNMFQTTNQLLLNVVDFIHDQTLLACQAPMFSRPPTLPALDLQILPGSRHFPTAWWFSYPSSGHIKFMFQSPPIRIIRLLFQWKSTSFMGLSIGKSPINSVSSSHPCLMKPEGIPLWNHSCTWFSYKYILWKWGFSN